MTVSVDELQGMPLREFPNLFRSLTGNLADPVGIYRGVFVGPRWLRAIAPAALSASGLGGWWGKRFDADGTAVNLVRRGGRLEPRFPMRLQVAVFALDVHPGPALLYGPENPFPWPHIIDELRPLGNGAILGMTHLKAGPLRKVAFPFTLTPQEGADGL